MPLVNDALARIAEHRSDVRKEIYEIEKESRRLNVVMTRVRDLNRLNASSVGALNSKVGAFKTE